jgi:uroporphyrinogen decarboxylase
MPPTSAPKVVWDADPALVGQALDNIAQTLATLVEQLIDAGAEGIFYAHTALPQAGLSRDRSTFERLSTPHDQTVFDAAGDASIIVHTCGPNANVEWFTDSPVSALSWDSYLPGNPALDEVTRLPVVGGVDRRLFDGTHADLIRRQARESAARNHGRPFLLSPTCSVDPYAVTDDDLRAFAEYAN